MASFWLDGILFMKEAIGVRSSGGPSLGALVARCSNQKSVLVRLYRSTMRRATRSDGICPSSAFFTVVRKDGIQHSGGSTS